MSDRIETVIAEAMHRATYGGAVDFADDFKYRQTLMRRRAQAILDALKAARIAVAELPEPIFSPRHQERFWEVGDSHVVFSEKWLHIRAELDYDDGNDDPLSVADARAFAAALLAAVDAAEASDE
ncbi:hypothetical protein [Mycolicibacterium fortuitum]|uniref:hypothetical protein n=1 Tax=Mycolicibacterium fortuitum TaxID=1766 RepID=UPI0007EAF980|nr:hypothetical protein [Mycolicibacterium fortuitum]OBF77039.1 hypothetical protein A5751_22940 [Mycolicibacterium fortuitum]